MINKILEKDLFEIGQSPIIDWNRFRNKAILVTGANGMLPSYIVFALLHQNKELSLNLKVIAQVRNALKAKDVFADVLNDEALMIYENDVTNPYGIINKLDFIIHAASQASPKYYDTDPVGTLMANVQGTINVLKLAQECNCESVLFFSSAEGYGTVEVEWIDEKAYGYLDPCSIRSCYSESKRMGEQLCVAWNKQYGTHCKMVRPFHTYTPTMKLDDGRVFADFVKNIVRGEDIVLKSTGDAKRAFCYATDATIGFLKILLDGTDGEAYNMGNPNAEISIRQLAETLIETYPEKQIKLVFDIDNQNLVQKSAVKSVLPSIEKLQKLGWTPQIDVRSGFRRVINYKLGK